MRIFRFAVISFFIVLGLLVLVGSSSVEAATYYGEYCWQDAEGGILRLAVTDMGNGHLLVNGRLTPTVGNVEAVHGNAEVVGTQVIIHITTSGFDADDIWSYTGNVVLDVQSLDGFVDGVSTWYEKQGGQSGITWDGQEALTYITCP